MNELLKPNQTVYTESSGMPCKVEDFLGATSDGEVYRAKLAGKAVTIKWYYPHYVQHDYGLRQRLDRATKSGPPSDRFLWPLDLVSAPGVPGFGSVWALLEPRFKSMVYNLRHPVQSGARALTTAAYELAQSFWRLHTLGFCYRDISSKNVNFDPDSGEVRICDYDNVDVSGREGPISGTPTYMAPEIVTGEATPSSDTDNFSLAILLFKLLVLHHPFHGAQELAIPVMDVKAEHRLYGTHPVFIFDPVDASNRPVPGKQDLALNRWPVLPGFIKKLFTRTFTEGIRDPAHGRVRDAQWRTAMARLRDSIMTCTCGKSNFFEAGASCWSCRTPLRPVRLKFETGSEVVIAPDTSLFPYHVDPAKEYDFAAPVATIVQHPAKPGVWGLRNCGDETWVITLAGGGTVEAQPGQTGTIVAGDTVNFGKREGKFVV